MSTRGTGPRRTICGLRWTIDFGGNPEQAKHETEALALHAEDHEALSYLHSLGYDCSQAFVYRGR